jgi:hypothetical protein
MFYTDCMLPMDMFIMRARLMLLFDGLLSERRVVKVCSEYSVCSAGVLQRW